eukprot:scaffold4851_cov428-Prasinococcus_capsulatus_cf.AAC.15
MPAGHPSAVKPAGARAVAKALSTPLCSTYYWHSQALRSCYVHNTLPARTASAIGRGLDRDRLADIAGVLSGTRSG